VLTDPAPARILVVDDEENISYVVATAVRLEGFDVRTADGGRSAIAQVADFRPDLLVLDVMLPDLDGFEVCRRLRDAGETVPVIFLTARDETEDRVHGLTIGADDYLTKPFSIEELIARIRIVLRRVGHSHRAESLAVADLVLNDDTHVVTRSGVPVELSPTEFNLLRYLLQNQGRVMSRNRILDHVWDYDFEGESTVVETFISSLRRKLNAHGPQLIHTVRGVGYRVGGT
jgi:two-component system OmpR family response regulator